MVETIRATVNGIHPLKAAAVAALFFLITGWTARSITGEAVGIPAQVQILRATDARHTAAIDSLRTANRDIRRDLARVLCYAESQAGVRPVSECVR